MARHVLKPAVLTAMLSLAAGCTHFTITPGNFTPPPAAEGDQTLQSPTASMEEKDRQPTGKPLPVAAPPAPMHHTAQAQDPRCTPKMRLESQGYFFAAPGGRKADQVKISVTGYGAPPKDYYPDAQKRLMAMRAAKLDALRSLAERVNGLRIWGGTTIGDMVVEKDRYRVFLDTFIRGARVMTTSRSEDGAFETVVELTVDRSFLTQVLENPRAQSDPAHDPCAQPGQNDPALTARALPVAGLENDGGTSFYFSQEQ